MSYIKSIAHQNRAKNNPNKKRPYYSNLNENKTDGIDLSNGLKVDDVKTLVKYEKPKECRLSISGRWNPGSINHIKKNVGAANLLQSNHKNEDNREVVYEEILTDNSYAVFENSCLEH